MRPRNGESIYMENGSRLGRRKMVDQHHPLKSDYQLRFLLTQRANAEMYPPVLHQAAILQKLGAILILDAPARRDDPKTSTNTKIRRIRIGASTGDGSYTMWANARSALRYGHAFSRCMVPVPNVAIAYEPDAAALLLRSRFNNDRMMRIVHLHEIPDKSLYSRSMVSRIAVRYMLRNLGGADLVVIPDANRASFAVGVAGLRNPPIVVLNCPRLQQELPESKLIPWLLDRGIATNRIVHFQGSLGHDRALAQVIESMIYWPLDAIFVMVGDGPSRIQQELRELAERQNMSSRVWFVGRVPYSEVFSFAVGAIVGVTLLESTNSNLRLSAGASNKRFEYAALGIPQVTSSGPGVQELFGLPKIATIVDCNNPEAIGKSIAYLLLNPPVAAEMSVRARRSHLTLYNYEAQFAPVVQRIEEWLSANLTTGT